MAMASRSGIRLDTLFRRIQWRTRHVGQQYGPPHPLRLYCRGHKKQDITQALHRDIRGGKGELWKIAIL